MTAIAAHLGSVPVAWRQLRSEPAKLVVALVAVAAAVALVLLLSGLRRGMGEQATVYLEHQPPLLVGQDREGDATLYFCSRGCRQQYVEERVAA